MKHNAATSPTLGVRARGRRGPLRRIRRWYRTTPTREFVTTVGLVTFSVLSLVAATVVLVLH